MMFLKTYFKTRALRQIIQWIIIAAVSIFGLGFFAVADAYAAASPTCGGADIAGTTTALAPADSGTLDFGYPVGNYQAEVCPYVQGKTYMEMQGWVWDANLGWISLYCKDGYNAGLYCGSVDYGVKINLTDGKMYGWAWGDNVGWISFGCQGALNDGSSCGLINYSGKTNLIVNKDLGEISGYAWADSVGWFNLTGPYASLLSVVVPQSNTETTYGVWTKAENTKQAGADKNLAPNKNTAPAADGSGGYDIFVNVTDINGNPITTVPGDTTVNITTSWNDTVHTDQTINQAGGYNDNNSGAVSKAGIGTNTFSSTGVTTGGVTALKSTLTSVAPTELNCWDGDSDGACGTADVDWRYADFGENIPQQTLTYNGASVTVTVSHGAPAGDESVTYTLPSLTFSNLEFNAPIELTKFLANGKNYIQSFRNTIDNFEIATTNRSPAKVPNPTIVLNLTTSDANVQYGWINSEEDVPPGVNPKTLTDFSDHTELAFPYVPQEVVEAAGGSLEQQVPGAKAYSVVSYSLGGKNIKYYSNGVPRNLESDVINQSLEILNGQVYSPGATQVTANIVITPIGDLATNALGDSIHQNVKNLISGADKQITDFDGEEKEFDSSTSYTSLKNGQVFYLKNANLHIQGLKLFNDLTEPATIIVDGGNIYIDTNINEPGSTGSNVPVGIIALANFDSKNEVSKGGRIYVHSSVTDLVDTYIYSDGPMFRYTDGICYFTGSYGAGLEGLREPNFVKNGRCDGGAAGYFDPVSTIVNQFYLKGTLASQNCIGCSSYAAMYRGDGQLLGTTNPTNFAIARLYDLNYFSYFRDTPEGLSGAQSKSITNIESAKGLPAGSMLSPSYFDYSAVPGTMYGFVKTTF